MVSINRLPMVRDSREAAARPSSRICPLQDAIRTTIPCIVSCISCTNVPACGQVSGILHYVLDLARPHRLARVRDLIIGR
jgi:hypothetical protein